MKRLEKNRKKYYNMNNLVETMETLRNTEVHKNF